MQSIRYLTLRNRGAFVVRMCIKWHKYHNGYKYEQCFEPEEYHDICVGAERTLDISACSIPDGATVTLIACVLLGKANTSNEFLYTSKSNATAIFSISGTTLNNQLTLKQVQ